MTKRDNNTTYLKSWYSVDFKVQTTDEKHKHFTKDKIIKIMSTLKINKVINKWFFLYEGNRFDVRMSTISKAKKSKDKLEEALIKEAKNYPSLGLEINTLSDYKERNDLFPDETILEIFANIMNEITKAYILKKNYYTDFNNFRLMERIAHCMFLTFCYTDITTTKNEKYFLMQRLAERMGIPFDDKFDEDNCYDNISFKKYWAQTGYY
tara:strand:+ start:25768 stop:26394 length:627 start_codon:yes stop_codon:yes gene_type:complete